MSQSLNGALFASFVVSVLLRLVAFGLIIAGVVGKNRRRNRLRRCAQVPPLFTGWAYAARRSSVGAPSASMKPPSHDRARPPTMLISFGGLPGTGKTTIARELARDLTAVYLRVDWIEHSMRSAGWPVEGEGYRVAHAVAEDNLRLGRIVVADSFNPWPQSRADWRAVAARTGVAMLDVEVVCSDAQEHRRRVTTRGADPAGQTLATWQDVVDSDYRAWDGERIVIDTARLTVEQCVSAILVEVLGGNQPAPLTGCAGIT